MKVKLNGIYQEYKSDVIEAIQEMLTEYPIIEKIVKIIHISKMSKDFEQCFASSKLLLGLKLKYEIKLNPIAFSKPNIQSLLDNTFESYYYSVKSIIYHEIGHCLQLFMLCKKFGLSLNKYNYFNYNKYSVLISNRAIKEYEKYFDKFFKMYDWSYIDIVYYLGSYAADNEIELLPECFNTYYDLRNNLNRNETEDGKFSFAKSVIEDYKKNYLS